MIMNHCIDDVLFPLKVKKLREHLVIIFFKIWHPTFEIWLNDFDVIKLGVINIYYAQKESQNGSWGTHKRLGRAS